MALGSLPGASCQLQRSLKGARCPGLQMRAQGAEEPDASSKVTSEDFALPTLLVSDESVPVQGGCLCGLLERAGGGGGGAWSTEPCGFPKWSKPFEIHLEGTGARTSVAQSTGEAEAPAELLSAWRY